MPTNLLITLSQALRDLPYDWKFAGYSGKRGGWSVELVSKCGSYHGNGVSQLSFVDAFTRAEKALELQMNADFNATLDYVDPADFDEAEQAMAQMGTGRM